MLRHVISICVILTAAVAAFADDPVTASRSQKKLDLGRPVEVARFEVDYSHSLFPIALEFCDEQVHAVYLTGRGRGGEPRLLYQRSADGGRTWDEAVALADSSMANACRDGDVMWIIAACGDTGNFQQYGTTVRLFRVDLKNGKTSPAITIVREAPEGEPARSFGMVSIAARGDKLLAGVMELRMQQPEATKVKTATLYSSSDAGRTWTEQTITDATPSGNNSIACWTMLKEGRGMAVLSSSNILHAELGKEGGALTRSMVINGEETTTAEPFRLLTTDDGFMLAYHQTDGHIRLIRSSDGKKWSAPVLLAENVKYDLFTPFTHMAGSGSMMVFGHTIETGTWSSGETSAQALLSHDGGKTFERINLGAMFRHGSMLPVTALDAESKHMGFLAVALVPENVPENAGDFFPQTQAFKGTAYLVFASSPPIAPKESRTNDEEAKRIEALINRLGSRDYQEREDATTKLREIAPDIVPFLEKAARDKDLEISTRARMILKNAYPPWLNPAPNGPAFP